MHFFFYIYFFIKIINACAIQHSLEETISFSNIQLEHSHLTNLFLFCMREKFFKEFLLLYRGFFLIMNSKFKLTQTLFNNYV